MTEKDYSLLRPFDLEVAKAGVLLCDQSGSVLAGLLCCTPDCSGYFRVWVDRIGGHVSCLPGKNIRLAPLCWIDGKPVYPDTPMEREDNGWPVSWLDREGEWQDIAGNLSARGIGFKIQWPRPKPVKRWINVYTGYSTKAEADQTASIGRIACIEIELPPLPAK